MKNDTTSVRMRSGDHLGHSKMSKKARHLTSSNLSFSESPQAKTVFQPRNERKRADPQDIASDFLVFSECPGSYDLSKFSDNVTPIFDFKKP